MDFAGVRGIQNKHKIYKKNHSEWLNDFLLSQNIDTNYP